jgi:hypothetical protein
MAQRLEATATAPALAPLRVLHRGTAMVQDYRALVETGTNRKIGLRHDPSLGHDELDPTTEKPTGRKLGAFVKLVDQPITISDGPPYRDEYIKALRQGDLWAADPETAIVAGVAFEPDFGGEHPEFSANDPVCQKVLAERAAVADAAVKAASAAVAEVAAQAAEHNAQVAQAVALQAEADAHVAEQAAHVSK